CGSPQAQTSSPGASSPGAPTASPAPRALTDRLVVQRSHVRAGTPIKGALVVTYRGHAPINLTRLNSDGAGLGCRPQYAVVLTNRRIPPDVNGQVAVPVGGQLKVPTPRVDHRLFRRVPPRARASRMR